MGAEGRGRQGHAGGLNETDGASFRQKSPGRVWVLLQMDGSLPSRFRQALARDHAAFKSRCHKQSVLSLSVLLCKMGSWKNRWVLGGGMCHRQLSLSQNKDPKVVTTSPPLRQS